MIRTDFVVRLGNPIEQDTFDPPGSLGVTTYPSIQGNSLQSPSRLIHRTDAQAMPVVRLKGRIPYEQPNSNQKLTIEPTSGARNFSGQTHLVIVLLCGFAGVSATSIFGWVKDIRGRIFLDQSA